MVAAQGTPWQTQRPVQHSTAPAPPPARQQRAQTHVKHTSARPQLARGGCSADSLSAASRCCFDWRSSKASSSAWLRPPAAPLPPAALRPASMCVCGDVHAPVNTHAHTHHQELDLPAGRRSTAVTAGGRLHPGALPCSALPHFRLLPDTTGREREREIVTSPPRPAYMHLQPAASWAAFAAAAAPAARRRAPFLSAGAAVCWEQALLLNRREFRPLLASEGGGHALSASSVCAEAARPGEEPATQPEGEGRSCC